jgi:hypothetical protein
VALFLNGFVELNLFNFVLDVEICSNKQLLLCENQSRLNSDSRISRGISFHVVLGYLNNVHTRDG